MIINQLRAARVAAGESQERLALRLGYNTNTVKDWESGRPPPTLLHLMNWCAALEFELVIRPTTSGAIERDHPRARGARRGDHDC